MDGSLHDFRNRNLYSSKTVSYSYCRKQTGKNTLKTAIWFFPLYLLIFTIFIFPIAWGGRLLFDGQNVNPEFYSILIPQYFDNTLITVLVFSWWFKFINFDDYHFHQLHYPLCFSNNLIIPYGLLGKFKAENETQNTRNITNIRKFSIFGLIILAFVFYKYFILKTSLDSVGLISFIVIAQLAPAMLSEPYSGEEEVIKEQLQDF